MAREHIWIPDQVRDDSRDTGDESRDTGDEKPGWMTAQMLG
jgi:hypothetical protein